MLKINNRAVQDKRTREKFGPEKNNRTVHNKDRAEDKFVKKKKKKNLYKDDYSVPETIDVN